MYSFNKEIKKKFTQIISLLLFSIILITLSNTIAKTSSVKTEKIFNETGNLLYKSGVPTLSSMGGEWVIIGLSRGDFAVDKSFYEDYYKNVVETIKSKNGVLSKNKYTEYSRVVISLTSIDKDVTNVGGYNLLSYLADYNKVKMQGINGPIWALIALDSGGYEIPETTSSEQTTREKLISYLLSSEIKTGGWALGGNTPDVDITAMTITSLARYYKSNELVKNAVDRGVKTLSEMQNSNGAFTFNKVESCESVAQVITCLSSLGVNPDTDSRFIKNGKSLVDALLDFAVKSGGFSHTKDGSFNQLATEQGYYSLVAYNRLLEGKNSLFNMMDEAKPEETLPSSLIITYTTTNTHYTENNIRTEPTVIIIEATTSAVNGRDKTSLNTEKETEKDISVVSESKVIESSSSEKIFSTEELLLDETEENLTVTSKNNNSVSEEYKTDTADSIEKEKNEEVSKKENGIKGTTGSTTETTVSPGEKKNTINDVFEEESDDTFLIVISSVITGVLIIVLIVLIGMIIKRKRK